MGRLPPVGPVSGGCRWACLPPVSKRDPPEAGLPGRRTNWRFGQQGAELAERMLPASQRTPEYLQIE